MSAGYVVTDPSTGEALATWPRALPPSQTPCRPDRSKGVRQHRCSRWHSELVEGFRAWAATVEAQAEQATIGYDTEEQEWWAARGGRPTLRAYLTGVGRPAGATA